MSRFRRLSHTLWHCQYHVVWVPKYRFRILTGAIKQATETGIHAIWHLKERGLAGVRLFTTDACLGLVESLNDFFPEAKWQRCTVHFYRNIFCNVPRSRMAVVADML